MKLVDLVEAIGPSLTAEEAKDAADKVTRDCKTYLQKIQNKILNKQVHLYRGTSPIRRDRGRFVEEQPRTDRAPSHTPQAIHQVLDQWFKENFGFPYRSSGVFTGNYEQAQMFGTAIYTVFPADPYKLLYSPLVQDLWRTLRDAFIDAKSDRYSEDVGEDYWRDLKNVHPSDLSQEDKELIEIVLEGAEYREVKSPIATRSGSEIMIQCNKYYGIMTKELYPDMMPTNNALTEEGSFFYYLLQNMGIK